MRDDGARRLRRLEFVEQVADLAFEGQDSRFVGGDAGIALAASRALGNVHDPRLANSSDFSCASFRPVNGYYFEKYNHERPHQSLDNLTPAKVYEWGASVRQRRRVDRCE